VILKNGQEVKISKTEWNLLKLLLKKRGEVASTEVILNKVLLI
jgi:DNA-binding winged helix-turn-helix (wHTH) protein